MKILFFLIFLQFLPFSFPKTKEEWKSRIIYQLLTDRFAVDPPLNTSCDLSSYCGGTFKGILSKLSYLKSLGVSALWISPIVANTPHGYHGYWLKSLYEINANFGTSDELLELIQACHAEDIWVMVDVVANHVGPVGTDYSALLPFNESEHFHEICSISSEDFLNNQQRVENCRLMDLPDLNSENPFVRNSLLSWIKDLVAKFSFDGIRIDTVPEVPKAFWKEFAASAGVFSIGEVSDGRISYVAGYQEDLDSTLNYPLYFQLKNVFLYGHSMREIESFYEEMRAFKDQAALGCFIDNHDNARFLSINNDLTAFMNYIAYNLASNGIPILYYGSEQGFSGGNDPKNREVLWGNFDEKHALFLFIKKINLARNAEKWYGEEQVQRLADDEAYFFSRGKVFFAFTNRKSLVAKTVNDHPYKEGDVLCDLLSDECVPVENMRFELSFEKGDAKILILKCNFGN